MAERRILLSGTRNFRDIGGYLTKLGTKRVKMGVLYRSDQLSSVSAEDAEKVLVGKLHIHHTYDMRGPDEASQQLYQFPGIERHPTPIDCANVIQVLKENFATATYDQVKGWLQQCYYYFVKECGSTTGGIIKDMLRHEINPNHAALFHCTAGKDRTGFLCYLILTLLEVDKDVIMEDYLLTNTLILQHEPELATQKTVMSACNLVDGPYLLNAMAMIEKDYGSVEKYATEQMGLTQEDILHLRNLLLENC